MPECMEMIIRAAPNPEPQTPSPHSQPSRTSLHCRRRAWRWLVRPVTSGLLVRIRRLLQLNPGLLSSKVAIRLRARGILRRRLVLVVRVCVVRMRRRRMRRRAGHPASASHRTKTASATATGIVASVLQSELSLGAVGWHRTYAKRKNTRKATPTMTAKATQRPQSSQGVVQYRRPLL